MFTAFQAVNTAGLVGGEKPEGRERMVLRQSPACESKPSAAKGGRYFGNLKELNRKVANRK